MSEPPVLINVTITLVALAVLGSGIIGWSRAIRRLRRSEPILTFEPRRAVPWGLADLVLLFCVLVIFQIIAVIVAKVIFRVSMPAPDEQNVDPIQLTILNLAYLNLFAIALPYFLLVRRATWRDLGIDFQKIRQDVVLGVKAFTMLAPIVYGMQAILVQWWPSKHPLVESLRDNAEPMMLIGGALAAIVAAPLFEEFAFRLLLQGWLENLIGLFSIRARSAQVDDRVVQANREATWSWLTVGPQRSSNFEADATQAEFMAEVAVDEPAKSSLPEEALPPEKESFDNPYQPPALALERPSPKPVTLHDAPIELPFPWRYLAIGLSTVIFALLHYQHGPDWIPLLVLAGGLGYIYQRTHRIVPCITVHFLINAVSFAIFLLEIFGPK